MASETGGGHTAAAQAVATALADLAPQVECLIVDVLREHSSAPFRYFPQLYGPLASGVPWLWDALFRATDSFVRVDLLTAASWPMAAKRLRRMMQQYGPNMLVSFHPLLVRPAVRLGREWRVPVACVVTDLLRLHAFWLDPAVDLYCMPTGEAVRIAVAAGVPVERIVLTGQPVPPGMAWREDRSVARSALGLDERLPLVLVTGGGAGIGPLRPVAEAICEIGQPLQLAVVCARNERLRRQLQRRHWPVPTRILGFVHDMPRWLSAADIVVTKAGPSTLAEAMAAGLPIIIMYALPGQETDNVRYLCSQGAAIWAPNARATAEAVRELLEKPERRLELGLRARSLARPQAAKSIATSLLKLLAIAGFAGAEGNAFGDSVDRS